MGEIVWCALQASYAKTPPARFGTERRAMGPHGEGDDPIAGEWLRSLID